MLQARPARVTLAVGWGGRDRTFACRNQNPVPYRLATPQCRAVIAARAGGFNARPSKPKTLFFARIFPRLRGRGAMAIRTARAGAVSLP